MIANQTDNIRNHYGEHRAIISFQKLRLWQAVSLARGGGGKKALTKLNPLKNSKEFSGKMIRCFVFPGIAIMDFVLG